VQGEGMENIQQNNAEYFPNLEKEMLIWIQEVSRTPNR
jgi:hypothetical protein